VTAAGSNVAFKIADRNMVTFDSLCKVAVALSNSTIANTLRRTV